MKKVVGFLVVLFLAFCISPSYVSAIGAHLKLNFLMGNSRRWSYTFDHMLIG